jgi:hypothetical protein
MKLSQLTKETKAKILLNKEVKKKESQLSKETKIIKSTIMINSSIINKNKS